MSVRQLRNTRGMAGVSTPIKRLVWVRDQWHTMSIITCCLRGASERNKPTPNLPFFCLRRFNRLTNQLFKFQNLDYWIISPLVCRLFLPPPLPFFLSLELLGSGPGSIWLQISVNVENYRGSIVFCLRGKSATVLLYW